MNKSPEPQPTVIEILPQKAHEAPDMSDVLEQLGGRGSMAS